MTYLPPLSPIRPDTAANSPSKISQRVFSQIESEAISPRPRWRYRISESGIWVLWGVTVTLGALACSVVLFVLLSARFAVYEATHQSAFTFFVDILPLLWLFLLVLMILLALFEVRHSKRGYRYNLVTIVGSSIGCSVLGAIILHLVGFGFWFDQALGKQIPSYFSMDKQERIMWHAPEAGRFVGLVVIPGGLLDPTVTPRMTLPEFRDSDGSTWHVFMESLTPAEQLLLLEGESVRIIATSTAPHMLHVCAVLPHLFHHPMKKAERLEYKREFAKRANQMADAAKIARSAANNGILFGLASDPDALTSSGNPCSTAFFFGKSPL